MATRRRKTPRRSPSTETLHPRAESLDLASSLEIVRLLNGEDLRAVRAVEKAARAIARTAERIAAALLEGGRLIYVGAGTSGRLGVLDAAECPPTFGTHPQQIVGVIAGGEPALRDAVEGAEDDVAAGAREVARLRVGPRDVVCGISASARTPFVHGALAEARRRGGFTALVCCARPESAEGIDQVILADTGPELVAGSTRLKAGTATKLILNALSTTALIRVGKVFRGRMVDLLPTNAKLRRRAVRIVAELGRLSPADAAAVLEHAEGSPRLALAMTFTGRDREEARALAASRGLRALQPGVSSPRARGRKAPARRRRPARTSSPE